MHPGARTDVRPPLRFTLPELRLGFGAWAVGGAGWGAPGAERDRTAAVERAVERGITFFDTAPSYGDGASELLVGRVLKPHGERVAIATKVGPHDDPRRSLEASLRRLQREYVDLVQLHEALDRWEWQLDKLHALQEEGKALAIGLCNTTHLQIARALELAPVVSYQGPYNLFDRDVEQRQLPVARERGLAFLAYRPLAAGLLSGKYAASPEFPAGDHRRGIYWFRGPEFTRRRAVIEQLRPIAQRLDLSLPALALAWVLGQPGVSVVLAGARTREQVDQQLTGTRHPTPWRRLMPSSRRPSGCRTRQARCERRRLHGASASALSSSDWTGRRAPRRSRRPGPTAGRSPWLPPRSRCFVTNWPNRG